MKNEDKLRAEKLLELLYEGNYFTTQKKEYENDHPATPFKITSRNELNLMVIDLLNSSNFLLHHSAQGLLDLKKDNYISVITLLKLALKSLKEDEMKL